MSKKFLQDQRCLATEEQISAYNSVVLELFAQARRNDCSEFLVLAENNQQQQQDEKLDSEEDKIAEQRRILEDIERQRQGARKPGNTENDARAVPAPTPKPRDPSESSLEEQNGQKKGGTPEIIPPQAPDYTPKQPPVNQSSDIISPRTRLTAKASGAVILLASLFKYRNDMYDGMAHYIKAVGNIFRRSNTKKKKPKMVASRVSEQPVVPVHNNVSLGQQKYGISKPAHRP